MSKKGILKFKAIIFSSNWYQDVKRVRVNMTAQELYKQVQEFVDLLKQEGVGIVLIRRFYNTLEQTHWTTAEVLSDIDEELEDFISECWGRVNSDLISKAHYISFEIKEYLKGNKKAAKGKKISI